MLGKPNRSHQDLLELILEPMPWETLFMQALLQPTSKESTNFTSPKVSAQLQLSTIALPVSLSHILCKMGSLVKLLIWFYKKVSKSLPWRCSNSTSPLLKSSSKYTRVFSQNSLQWLSIWLPDLALSSKLDKKTPWTPSESSAAPWIQKSLKTLDQTQSELDSVKLEP